MQYTVRFGHILSTRLEMYLRFTVMLVKSFSICFQIFIALQRCLDIVWYRRFISHKFSSTWRILFQQVSLLTVIFTEIRPTLFTFIFLYNYVTTLFTSIFLAQIPKKCNFDFGSIIRRRSISTHTCVSDFYFIAFYNSMVKIFQCSLRSWQFFTIKNATV